MRHRRLVALLCVAVLGIACSGSEAEPVPPIGGDSPEASPSPSPSPSPEPEDPYAIPDEIDEAYVDLVTNEILAGITQILADILRQPVGYSLSGEDGERLGQVASGTRLQELVADYQSFADTPRKDMAFLDPDDFGQLTWDTELILEASDACIVAIGFYDNSQISTQNPSPDEFTLMSLEARASAGETTLNPTPWRLRDVVQLVNADGEQIPRDSWATLDYSILDTTCEGDET